MTRRFLISLLALLALAGAARAATDTLRASEHGCALNTNLSSGGGTDDSDSLQALLNHASGGQETYLIVDGPARVTKTLNIYSNTTVDFRTTGSGIYLTSSSNCPIFENAHPVQPWTARTDRAIRIVGAYPVGSGGYFNCNGGSQTDKRADSMVVVGMQFMGVCNLRIDSIHTYNARTWGLGIWYSDTVVVHSFRHSITAGTVRISQDGIDIRGPSRNVSLTNLRIRSYDDAIALNARDMQGRPDYGHTGSYGGDITNVTIDSVWFDSCLLGFDIIADTQTVDSVHISNVWGWCDNYIATLSICPYGIYPNTANDGSHHSIGHVWFNNLAVRECKIKPYKEVSPYQGFANRFLLYAAIQKLSITNWTNDTTYSGNPLIYMGKSTYYGYHCDSLILDSLTEYNAKDTTTPPRIKVRGYVGQLNLSHTTWSRPAGLPDTCTLIGMSADTVAGIGQLRIHTMSTTRLKYILKIGANDTLRSVVATNVTQATNPADGVSFSLANGLIIDSLILNGWSGPTRVYRGTSAIKKLGGDAFLQVLRSFGTGAVAMCRVEFRPTATVLTQFYPRIPSPPSIDTVWWRNATASNLRLFWNDDSSEIPLDVIACDTATKVLYAFARITTRTDTTRDAYLLSGCTAASAYAPCSTWNAACLAVLPLHEATGTFYDRTRNGLNAYARGSVTRAATAQMYKGIRLNGNTANNLTVVDSGKMSFTSGGGTDLPYTVSAGIKIDTVKSFAGIVVRGQNSGKFEWAMRFDTFGNGLSVWQGTPTLAYYVGRNAGYFADTATWYRVTSVYDASKTTGGDTVYYNATRSTGGTISSLPYPGMTAGTDSVRIGVSQSNPYKGSIEMVVVESVARDTHWVANRYSSWVSPTTWSPAYQQYITGPHIDSINPTSGPTSGGTSVRVRGTNFRTGGRLNIGGNWSVVSWSDTLVVATSAAHAADTIDAVLITVDSIPDTLGNAWTFVSSGGLSNLWNIIRGWARRWGW